ncbi:hypothetical protein LEP1GSC073_0293 [Leptospira noguchii str. Cascata]|nr:hypothetical protein LEP1GSC073_0293 [Leptospira noguchii str. Cascata]
MYSVFCCTLVPPEEYRPEWRSIDEKSDCLESIPCKSLGGSREAFSFKNITKGENNVGNNGKSTDPKDHGNGRGKVRNLYSEDGRAGHPDLFR